MTIFKAEGDDIIHSDENKAIAGYYASVSFMDVLVEKVLQPLEGKYAFSSGMGSDPH
jgi:hypothetical protein